ncbi:hypothetical protein RN001_005115 [Aquatica leii]|uniref:Cilia- and flagella-associated protein 45 n=1 Tax=Aquatica leii TaxID=1421715 RepID=A0AAN7PJD4_9COLE|nr:hypothetical protein RN001_005115 [Aquatica leii]
MRSNNGKKSKTNLKNHTIQECNHKLNGEYIHDNSNMKESILNIKMFNKNGLRQIIVPSHDVKGTPGIWPDEQYKHLKKQSHVFTKQDKLNIIEEAQKKQERVVIDSLKRREALENARLEQRAVPNSKLYNEEEAAGARSMYVLQRAIDLRQEQEDNIKYANGVILVAKCKDIRKKQIIEKNLMKKELNEEEERLDQMMEQERQKLLKKEEIKEIKKKEINQKTYQGIVEQIQEHEYNKIIENEQKKEENRLIQKRIKQMKEEDEEQARQKILEQLKTRESLNKANEELLRIKTVKKEEERIADCRIQEFVRAKTERDEKYQAILAERKAEKDRAIAILQALQEKAQGEQSVLDEIKAQKIQKQFDREKKENERLADLKRKKVIQDLKKGRQQQVEDIQKSKSLEEKRELCELNKGAQIQNDLYEKDKERERLRKMASLKYRKELLEQIHSHEVDRIQQIRQKFEEGFSLKYKMEAHDIGIKNTLHKKMQRLHESNVPDCVIKDIERTLKM